MYHQRRNIHIKIYIKFNIKVIKVAQGKPSHIPEIVLLRSLTVAEKQKFSEYRYYLGPYSAKHLGIYCKRRFSRTQIDFCQK